MIFLLVHFIGNFIGKVRERKHVCSQFEGEGLEILCT